MQKSRSILYIVITLHCKYIYIYINKKAPYCKCYCKDSRRILTEFCKLKVLSNVRNKACGFALRFITFAKNTKVGPLETHSQATLFKFNKVGARACLAYALALALACAVPSAKRPLACAVRLAEGMRPCASLLLRRTEH